MASKSNNEVNQEVERIRRDGKDAASSSSSTSSGTADASATGGSDGETVGELDTPENIAKKSKQYNTKTVLLLQRDGGVGEGSAGVVAEHVDEAATAYLVSLEELVQHGFRLVPRSRWWDVTDPALVAKIDNMMRNPASVAEDIHKIFLSLEGPSGGKKKKGKNWQTGGIPAQLLKRIHEHRQSMNRLNVHNELSVEDAKNLVTYNDLLISAWLYWIQP